MCVRASTLILLQLVETHLLTAAHLIPLLSTGKRVFSLSLSPLSSQREFSFTLVAVCVPSKGEEKKDARSSTPY